MGRNSPAREFTPTKRENSCQSNAQPAATRRVPLRNMVVTPAIVPEFTIPSLCPARLQGCGRQKAGIGNVRRHTIPRSTHPSSLVRALTRCCPFPEEHEPGVMDDLQTHALSDPTTRAAMSLPHLSKITTPYGFLTLGESPCVRRRESLFFEETGFQECLNEAEHVPWLTAHGRGKSNNQSCYFFSQVGNGEIVCARSSEQPQASSLCSKLVRSGRLSDGSLQKSWIKCIPKAPWSR